MPGLLVASVKAQWEVVNKEQIPATWLWQYAVLKDVPVMEFAKKHEEGQEFGLFLEVEQTLASDAHVLYRGVGPWYFSNGLLLSSYDPQERKRLIDTAFTKFKDIFGYFPKTVGAWWIGADSLQYMHDTYGVVASLRAADQFDLDTYSIWGTPWSIPYVSSSENAAIPALSVQNSTHVLMLQWAARDPLQGYGPAFSHATYSVQDYSLKKYNTDYLSYLLQTYLRKPMDNISLGLEGGYATYDGEYLDRLSLLHIMQDKKKISLMLAKDYAESFLKQNNTIAPTHTFLTKDFQTDDQSFWFNSANFRVGIQKRGDEIYLVDLRNYGQTGAEDFLKLPNSQGELRIDTLAQIDSTRDFSQRHLLATSQEPLVSQEKDGVTTISAGKKVIGTFTDDSLHLYDSSVLGISLTVQNRQTVHIFWLLLFLLIVYILFVYLYTRSFRNAWIHGVLLIGTLVIARQFLSNGVLDQLIFSFDKKSFLLFLLPKIPYISSPNTIILLFQIIPFVLLLGAHFIFIVKKWTKFSSFWYAGAIYLYAFFYAHLFYFPFDRSTYKIIGSVLVLLAIGLCSICGVIWRLTRSIKRFGMFLLLSAILIVSLVFLVVFSRQMYVLNPFEQRALTMIENNHTDGVLLLPTTKPIYKAERPLLYDFPSAAHIWTKTRWIQTTSLSKSILHNKILLVPRYLGSSISDKEIQTYHLEKIFDNGQIVLYKENETKRL
jgi:hypothetical protein